jgi:hypothetical protein
LGTIILPYVILTIIAFNKCFSNPGKLGKEKNLFSRLPVRIGLSNLEILIYSGEIKGSFIQS